MPTVRERRNAQGTANTTSMTVRQRREAERKEQTRAAAEIYADPRRSGQQESVSDVRARTYLADTPQVMRDMQSTMQRLAEEGRQIEESRPPSYRERVEEEASKYPKPLRGLGYAIGAIAEAPISRAIGYYAAPEPVREEVAARNQLTKPEGAAALIGQVVAPFAVPGAGLGTGLGIAQGTGQVLSRVAPGLSRTAGGRIAQEAIKEGVAGAAVGAGTEFAQGSADPRQALINAAVGAGAGGALGAAGRGVGEAVTAGRQAAEDAARTSLRATTALDRAANAPQYAGRLRLPSAAEDISRTLERIRPEVSERMTPPLESEKALREWIKPYLGDVSNNELRKLSYDDLVELADEARRGMNMYDVAVNVARERGINLPQRFEGRRLSDRVRQDASRRAYGFPQPDLPSNAYRPIISEPVRQVRAAPEPTPVAPQASQAPVEQAAATTRQSAPAPLATTRPGSTAQRGFVRTLSDSGRTANEVVEGLENSPASRYQRITNVETVAKANRRIERGIDEAEAQLLGKTKFKAEDVATGLRLIDVLQQENQINRAVTIAEKLARQLTEAGQAVQAVSIWHRLTPEGALLAAQRRVNSINDNLLRGQKELRITNQQAQNITDAASAIQASGASQERAGLVMQIMDRVRKGETISPEDRQTVADFVDDAKRFLTPEKPTTPKVPKTPKELDEPRVRDRVVSFLEAQEQAARERIRARRNQLSSTPFDTWGDYAIIGASKIAKGVRDFADWSEQMAKDFGDEIRPYLAPIYEKAQSALSRTSKSISRGKIEQAEKIAKRITQNKSDKAQANDQLADLANAVRDALSKSKQGTLTVDDVNRIRELSQETVELMGEPKPLSEEARYIKAVRQLARKLASAGDEAEEAMPSQSESVKEIQTLLRQVSNIANEGIESTSVPIDKDSIDTLAYELFERAKPSTAEKIATSYIKKNAAILSDEDVSMIRELAQSVSRLSGKEKQAASQELQAILSGFENVGIGRRLSALQYISMLLNPLTQIRNIAGNELLYRIERFSRILGTPIDVVASKLSGGPRTVTFKRGPMVWDNYFQPAKEFWSNLGAGAKSGWRGVSPEGLTSKYEIQGQAFRSKYNPLTYMEKALGAALQGFDYAAYQRAVTGRLQEMAYLDAINSGIKGADNIRRHMQTYMTNLDQGVEDIAKQYGKYVTLQDDSVLSRTFTGFRRGLNRLTGSPNFGAGSLVLPFAKTPANLLNRALDYSPAGIIKSIYQASQVLRNPRTDLTRADVISSVSRALMGSGIGAVAYWLADKGALFGQTDSDPETRKLQQLTGIRDFQINGSALMRMLKSLGTGGDIDAAAKLQPGDVLWQYEWAQPSSMPMAIGANIAQGIKGEKGAAKTATDAALAGANTLYNSSVLSGIREAFQIPTGEDNVVKAVAMNLAKQIPGMFTPSFLRQFNTIRDDSVRETYDPDWLTQTINPSRANIPGQAQQLPQRVDTLGRPQTRPNSVFDVFLNPAARSRYEPTPEAQLVLELLSETGDTRVAPRAVAKYLSGKDVKTREQRKVNLTPEQYVRLQTIVGQESAKRIGKINPKLPTDRKVELVIKALDEAGKIGRTQLKKELGLR